MRRWHSWQVGQAAIGLILEGSVPEVLDVLFFPVPVVSVGAMAVGAALSVLTSRGDNSCC